MIPLAAIASFKPGNTPLSVNHRGLFVATTISFNLAQGAALSDATAAVDRAMAALGVPSIIHGTFQGTARVFQQSLATEPYLVAATIWAQARWKGGKAIASGSAAAHGAAERA